MTEQIIEAGSIAELRTKGITEISAAIGVFDGVHAGHRHLLSVLTDLAQRTDSVPAAVTFSPHPRQILTPETAPALLLPPSEKIRRLHEAGAAAVVTIPFTKEFAALSPKAFIEECLRGNGIGLRGLCVGKAWRFGAKGAGDTSFLEELSGNDGFLFSAVEELILDGETVSSSTIRAAAASGNFKKASRYLTKPYEIYGTVVHGYGIAGSKLKTPTANIRTEYGVLPPNGVYAAFVRADGVRHPAVVNIGSAPTFQSYGDPALRRVEAHLLDGEADLYGKNLVLQPVSGLRPEQKFLNINELQKQIRQDCQSALNILQGKDALHEQ